MRQSIYCFIILLLILPSRQISIQSGNITLEQSYPYGKMWLSQKSQQVMTIIRFKTQYRYPPKVIVGIMKFDGMPNNNNMTSINVSVYNITTSSFNLLFTKGDGYFVFSSIASWLSHGQKSNQYGFLQVRLVSFPMPDGFNLGAMWTERKTTSRRQRVNLPCFDNQPSIMIGLRKLDGRGGFEFGFSFLTIQATLGVIENCSAQIIFTKSHEYKAGDSVVSGVLYSRTNNTSKSYLQNLAVQTGQSQMPDGYPNGIMWLNNQWSANTIYIIKFSRCFDSPPDFKVFFSGIEAVSTYQNSWTQYWNSFEVIIQEKVVGKCEVRAVVNLWHYGKLKSLRYSWIAVGTISKQNLKIYQNYQSI